MSLGIPLDATCYRHPDRLAGSTCRRCERPICSDCMVQASVGWQCSSCVKRWSKKAPVIHPLSMSGAKTSFMQQSPVVVGLIAINVAVFIATGLGSSASLVRLGMDPLSVHQGEWYRVITSAFMHVSIWHILLNMYSLAIVGPIVEKAIGRWKFLCLYILAALGGSAGVYLMVPVQKTLQDAFTGSSLLINVHTYTAGASGAIFGLFGACWIVARDRGLNQSAFVGIIVVNLLFSFLIPGISWEGHIGGLVTGGVVAFGVVAAEKFRGSRETASTIALFLVTLIVLIAVFLPYPPHLLGTS